MVSGLFSNNIVSIEINLTGASIKRVFDLTFYLRSLYDVPDFAETIISTNSIRVRRG